MLDTEQATIASPKVLTVSELNRMAKEVLEQSFPLFWVSGEISNLTRASVWPLVFLT
jgi:exodeoxyribonuclease VII large subunit